jgi:short-subunit dehydrogenase
MPKADRYAIVTGGGGGIGREFCRQLAARGWTIAVADVDAALAEQTAAECAGARCCQLDVSQRTSWCGLHSELAATWPRLDLLVNCAGVLLAGEVSACAPESIEQTVAINLLGTIWGAQVMVPWLTTTRVHLASDPPRGVINIASIFGVVSPPEFATYAASKGGVLAFSEALRGELKRKGLNLTVAVPGITRTGLFERGLYSTDQLRRQTILQAADATVSPEDVARVTLDAAARYRLYAPVGRRASWYWRLKRLMPQSVIDTVGRRVNRTFVQQARQAPPQP